MLTIQGLQEHDFANGTELTFESERQQMLRAMPDCAYSQACNRLKKGRREATVDISTFHVWQNKLQSDIHLYRHTAAALNLFCTLLHIGEPRYDAPIWGEICTLSSRR